MMQARFLLCWCALPTLILPINCAITSSSTVPDPPLLLDGLYNTTLGGNIDSRFSLQSHYSTTRLPATAILMNTLTILTEAADLEYHDAFDFNRHATFADYPSVSIGRSWSTISPRFGEIYFSNLRGCGRGPVILKVQCRKKETNF